MTTLPAPGEDYDFAVYEGKMFPITEAFKAYDKFIFLLKNERTRFLAVILMEIAIGKINLNASKIGNSFIGEALLGLKIGQMVDGIFEISEVYLVLARAICVHFGTFAHLKNNIIRSADLNTQITFPFSLFNSKTKVLKKKSLNDLNPYSEIEEELVEGSKSDDEFWFSVVCGIESNTNEETNSKVAQNQEPEPTLEASLSSKMKDFLSSL